MEKISDVCPLYTKLKGYFIEYKIPELITSNVISTFYNLLLHADFS